MKNALAQEWIGRIIEVAESTNPGLVGLKGVVVDETKNTLLIRQDEKTRRLIKEQIKFIVKINDKRIKIDGKKITKRPEKRL